jgi:hypothetical protein
MVAPNCSLQNGKHQITEWICPSESTDLPKFSQQFYDLLGSPLGLSLEKSDLLAYDFYRMHDYGFDLRDSYQPNPFSALRTAYGCIAADVKLRGIPLEEALARPIWQIRSAEKAWSNFKEDVSQFQLTLNSYLENPINEHEAESFVIQIYRKLSEMRENGDFGHNYGGYGFFPDLRDQVYALIVLKGNNDISKTIKSISSLDQELIKEWRSTHNHAPLCIRVSEESGDVGVFPGASQAQVWLNTEYTLNEDITGHCGSFNSTAAHEDLNASLGTPDSLQVNERELTPEDISTMEEVYYSQGSHEKVDLSKIKATIDYGNTPKIYPHSDPKTPLTEILKEPPR